MRVVYIAGKYSGRTHDGRSFMEIERNILAARESAILVMACADVVAITPHLNSYHMELDFRSDQDFWYRADLEILMRCDAIYLIPGWEHSKGACIEQKYAEEHSIPIFTDIEKLGAWANG